MKAFAGVPQVPRKTFWCLREPRKSLGKLFGVCGNPASLSKNFLVFAGVPQVSRETFWCLRESRKRLGKCCGTCAACANVLANAVELAQLAQTSWQMPRYLRSLRKRLGKCRRTCAACANVSAWSERSFPTDTSVTAFILPTYSPIVQIPSIDPLEVEALQPV